MGFDINNFLNAESKKEVKSDWKPVKLSVHKLRPAAGKENFYHMDDKEIEETARTIELVGIQQYPVVKPIPDSDEYEIIAGHKRRLAILKLLTEGKTEYEMIPCKIETAEDSIKNRLILIFTNSTQRERTDYEKMQEIKEVRQLLTEWQKDNKISGKLQNVIAEVLGTNKTKVGTLEHIDGRLIEPFKNEFAAGKISTDAANKIAGLDDAAQQALYEIYKETGSLTAEDVKAIKKPDKQQEAPKEPPKEAEAKETPKEPVKAENEAQDKPQPQFMNEPETKVTYNAPTPDNTDRRTLIINGKINRYKEFNGMTVNYFMGAVIGSDLFDTEFWQGWKENTGAKWEYIADYAGTKTTYTVQTDTTEKCEALLTDTGLEVSRVAAGQTAVIRYEELAELIDIMIYTKVIEITTIESDLKYWAARTTKELTAVSNYLTENEIYILQDLMMKHMDKEDNAPYIIWQKEGLLTVTTAAGGIKTDYKTILAHLHNIIDEYDIDLTAIGYDPHNASAFLLDLEDFGCDLVEIKQSARSLNDATIDFQLEVKESMSGLLTIVNASAADFDKLTEAKTTAQKI